MIAGLPATSLANVLFASAARHPDRPAMVTMDESASYAQLRGMVINFAQHMRRHGIGHTSRLALNVDHPIVGTALILACSLTGSFWMRVSPEALAAAELRLTHLVTTEPLAGHIPLPVVALTPDWSRPPPSPQGTGHKPFTHMRGHDDTWHVSQSSGTTGTPKFMAMAESYVRERTINERFYVDLPDNPRFFSYFPALSWLGLRGTLRVLHLGGTVMIGDLSEVFGRTRVDCVFGSPAQFLGFMNAMPAGADIAPAARIAHAVVVGASAGKPFFNRMLRYFSRMAFGYASTEASIISVNVIDAPDETPGDVHVGHPRADVTVEIVNEDGTQLPAMAEGIIRLRTPRQVAGYVGNPALTREVFRDGWFHPGDTGYLDDGGALHITGRVTDRVNIGGLKLNPELLDRVAAQVPGIRECVCFAMPGADGLDELAAAVTLDGPVDVKSVGTMLRDRIAGRFGTAARMRRLYAVADIPRSATGKAARHALAEAARGWTATELG